MSFHSRLLFVPATAIFAAALPQAAVAVEVQTLQEAQAKLAPGATLTPADFKLEPEQRSLLKESYKVPVMRPAVKAWRVSTGGWLFLDQVYGREDIVTYLVSVGDDNKVRGIEVLVCADGYCDLFSREWRANLVGRTHGKWMPEEVVPMVSGATLSCVHVAEGVKKILAIHARFMPAAG
ncbi:MAG: FMN-binding protein [Steroidobacteraceae bacterium]|jgi:hypothetical protein|nr:FMN-binding protein [Steroidobacteraceae bacterium]